MIDLHAHTFLSDGKLVAAELFRRAVVLGYKAFAITDHVDSSNIERVVDELTSISYDLAEHVEALLIPGVEITHVPPPMIPPLIERARALGAKIVVVHGETIVEPVTPGTNLAAIQGGADILAHPGFIAEAEVVLAKEKSVFLELSARRGHSLANGHILQLVRKVGANAVINSDTHEADDLLTEDMRKKVGRGMGLSEVELANVFGNSEEIVKRME